MRFLVTGTKGLLGSELSRWLRDKGEEVVGWDLPDHDITQVDRTINEMHRVRPEVVFHLAAWTDVDGCEKNPGKATAVNTQGAWTVALGAAEVNARMVYLSTDYVFDGTESRPYDERDRPNPLSVYGRSKLMGEKAVMRSCGKFYVVRTSGLFGRHGPNFVDKVLDACRGANEPPGPPRDAKAPDGEEARLNNHQDTKGTRASARPQPPVPKPRSPVPRPRVRVVADQTCSPTYAADLCEPLYDLVRLAKPGVYHLTNSGQCSWFELAQRAIELAGVEAEVVPITAAELGRPAPRPVFSVLENRNYKRKFGKLLRPWQEALAEYLGGR